MRNKGNKRGSNTVGIKKAIQDFIKSQNLKPRFDEVTLITSWEELMGEPIAKRTGKIFFKNDVLFVEINSAPLKHELSLTKSKILGILENKFGKGMVSDIIFM